jgi:hypothetical protein
MPGELTHTSRQDIPDRRPTVAIGGTIDAANQGETEHRRRQGGRATWEWTQPMKRPRKHPTRIAVTRLEDRRLLSGPGAAWIGQDGHDYTGPYPVEIPDGIQDVRIALSDLPADRRLTSAEILGLGGGHWVYNGPYGPWKAALVRPAGSTTGDLFFEADRVETGRPFNVILRFDDGSTADLWLDGGTADPNLRMPSASLALAWVGQDGSDRAGPGLGVGPDGVQDVRLTLSRLSSTVPIESVTVTGPPGITWQSGLNHAGYTSAELVRDPADSTRADLYLNPDRNLAGQTLTVEVTYTTGRTDTATIVAGPTDPALRVASAPAPPAVVAGVSARWVGQDGPTLGGTGWARLEVSGLPTGRSVVGATLSGPTPTSWAYRAAGRSPSSDYADPFALPLAFQAGSGGRADLAFPPDRDEAGAALLLRLTFDDGSMAIAPFTGGTTDLGRLSAEPAPGSIAATPGDDLNALADRYGTITLAPGEYRLDRPLVLNRPVTITAPQGGATLVFRQRADDAPWSAAIKIHAGNTMLDGFAVRFDGPVRWRSDVNYGPAVIGTTDNLDSGHDDPKADIALTRLDVQAPPASTPGEEAPDVIRLASAAGGRVEGNTLRGGTTVFLRGPWRIVGNTYLGTMPDTWAWEVFAGHFTHDLVLKDNVVSPVPGAGRTWRFLVQTGNGDGDLIEGNTVSGIGPRDTDPPEASVNAAEIILTEAYSLRFEGKPLSLSPDGRILQIPAPQGDPAGSGDVVAILDGPHAGQWRRIAQALGPTTYLLADPLPGGDYTVSIGTGFVNQTYRDNTVDVRGSSVAAGMVLVGNHYGTRVVGNHILGGGEAIRVAAFPTERPSIWGWSHNPFLGATISGNTIEDALRGMTLTVMHGPPIKSNKGRLYLSAEVRDNLIVWSDAFAAADAGGDRPPGITVGEVDSIDPDELRLSMSGNRTDVPAGPAPALVIDAGNVDGEPLIDTVRPLPTILPGAPSALALVADTGTSGSDGLTRDPRLSVGPADRAVAFEYRVKGSSSYRPVGKPSAFRPEGLSNGPVSVTVRAIDARGRRGPEVTLNFVLDTIPPVSTPPALRETSDTGRSDRDGITGASSPSFTASGDPTDRVELLRNGKPVASGGPGTLTDPGPLPDGIYQYNLRRTDAAGNVSISRPIVIVVDTTAPAAVGGLSATSAGVVSFRPTSPSDEYAYRVGDGPFRPLGQATSFTPEGLAPGANRVEVVAIDVAGNVGPSASVVVDLARTSPTGRWIGQDGRDLVGPYPVAVPDGIQDIHVALAGLPAGKTIAFVDVQGLGGSQWQYGGGWGPWKAALVRTAGSTTADLYIQPDRAESGRPFQVTLRYTDGSTDAFWVIGGTADPRLRVPGGGSRVGRASASDPTGSTAPPPEVAAASSTGPVQGGSSRPAERLSLKLQARKVARERMVVALQGAFGRLLARRQGRR